MTPEQIELNFGGNNDGQPKVEIHEQDECNACGNYFEGPGGCFQCSVDKRKINWKIEQSKKEPRH